MRRQDELPIESLDDPLAGVTIAIGKDRPGHASVFGAVLVQLEQGTEHRLAGSPDQLDNPRRHRLGPFGHVAQHQNGLAKRRRLFLKAAAVGYHAPGILDRRDDVAVAQWIDQFDPGMSRKNFDGGFARIWIGMNRKIHRDVGGEVDECPDRSECVP